MDQRGNTVKSLNQQIDQKGAAAVEFAIVLPFLVLLVFGIIEFGTMFYNEQVITNASREGARVGIVQWKHADGSLYYPSEVETLINATVQNYVGERLITFGTNNPPVVSYPDGPPMQPFGQDFSVRITYIYNYLASSIFGLGTTKTLEGRTLMKMEEQGP